MYNFFVTARSGAWDDGFYVYERSLRNRVDQTTKSYRS